MKNLSIFCSKQFWPCRWCVLIEMLQGNEQKFCFAEIFRVHCPDATSKDTVDQNYLKISAKQNFCAVHICY